MKFKIHFLKWENQPGLIPGLINGKPFDINDNNYNTFSLDVDSVKLDNTNVDHVCEHIFKELNVGSLRSVAKFLGVDLPRNMCVGDILEFESGLRCVAKPLGFAKI